MAAEKRKTKQKVTDNAVAEQLEHAFLAGLGALSNAQKAGAKTFDSLVRQGKDFRKKTTRKTESLIDDVQDAIRDMADDAQSRASGLLDQVRDRSKLDKLQSAFDQRVAGTMDRLHVPSKNDIDDINRKLDKIIRLLSQQDKSPAPKRKVSASAKKPAARKTTAKKATRKKAAGTSK